MIQNYTAVHSQEISDVEVSFFPSGVLWITSFRNIIYREKYLLKGTHMLKYHKPAFFFLVGRNPVPKSYYSSREIYDEQLIGDF
jgi:hypothetical protein